MYNQIATTFWTQSGIAGSAINSLFVGTWDDSVIWNDVAFIIDNPIGVPVYGRRLI